MYKIFLCGITYAQAYDEVVKNIIPLAKYFDGLNWVVNKKQSFVEGYHLEGILEASKKGGSINSQDWLNRYDFARNRYLFDPCMDDGDFFLVLDSLETITHEFAQNDLPKLAQIMGENGLDALYLHGKLLFARKNEWMYYSNAVHEQLQGIRKAAELTQIEGYEDSSRYFTNTRPLTRPKDHWISSCHFLKYWVISPIQCVMGAEGNEELIQKRMYLRDLFKRYMPKAYEFSVDGILKMFKEQSWAGLHAELQQCINEEKILNDVYRYHVLGEKDLTGDWDFEKIRKI